MRGAAISDLHLGYRYGTRTEDGRNVREKDVERAWAHAVDIIRDYQPAIVTIAGDIFHHPRVSDYARFSFLRGLHEILTRTSAAIIMVLGNHDAGRTADVLSPVELAKTFGSGTGRLWVIDEPRRVKFSTLGQRVSVACFPFVTRKKPQHYSLAPDREADVNILLIHAAVKGSPEGDKLPFFYGSDQALDVGREAEAWDVVHVGDFHEYRELHPTRMAFYSGALERTSSNIWDEHRAKGVVLYNLMTEQVELAEVPTREVQDWDLGDFDLPPGVGAEEVNQCLAKIAENRRLAESLFRFKVDAFPREEREHIDWAMVRTLKSKATYFYLDVRYAVRQVVDLGDSRDRKILSLGEEAARFFADDPEEVRATALGYLEAEAEAEEEGGPEE